MNVHYLITYDLTTREILTCIPAGPEYPAEGVIEGTNTGLLHKVTGIEGRIQDWSDNHWVNDDYTFVYKGDTPGNYWIWNTDTRVYEFNKTLFWEHVRRERNLRLAMSDWTQFDDAPLSSLQKENWKSYRTALRDIPSENDEIQSMNAIPWPAPPDGTTIKVTVW